MYTSLISVGTQEGQHALKKTLPLEKHTLHTSDTLSPGSRSPYSVEATRGSLSSGHMVKIYFRIHTKTPFQKHVRPAAEYGLSNRKREQTGTGLFPQAVTPRQGKMIVKREMETGAQFIIL